MRNLLKRTLLYEEASELNVGAFEYGEQARRIFAEAAQLFEDALFTQTAAEAWGAAGEHKNAAEVFKRNKEYGKAALWYMRANDFLQSAQCHHWAEQHDQAVKAYRKGGHWTELLAYLEQFVTPTVLCGSSIRKLS